MGRSLLDDDGPAWELGGVLHLLKVSVRNPNAHAQHEEVEAGTVRATGRLD